MYLAFCQDHLPVVTLAVVFFRQESSASVYINNKQPIQETCRMCSVVWMYR